jgi:hypothetical protein
MIGIPPRPTRLWNPLRRSHTQFSKAKSAMRSRPRVLYLIVQSFMTGAFVSRSGLGGFNA